VKFHIERSFDKDIDKTKDKNILLKLQDLIISIEKAKNISEISHLKKLRGYDSFYRIRIGDYRLGIELISENEIVLARFLHRKDIYKHFPKK
jgi:mRNA interferase RelE/StbE